MYHHGLEQVRRSKFVIMYDMRALYDTHHLDVNHLMSLFPSVRMQFANLVLSDITTLLLLLPSETSLFAAKVQWAKSRVRHVGHYMVNP